MAMHFISFVYKGIRFGFKSFLQRDSGATAIEFALLAVPFFFLILGILELSLFYASGVMLEGAATSAARVIRTGQVQDAEEPQDLFEDTMCDKVGALISCNDIVYESIKLDNFNDVQDAAPRYDEDGNMISAGFDPGQEEEVIMVRLAYRHQFLTPLLGPFLESEQGSNSALHISTVVMRTEPYKF